MTFDLTPDLETVQTELRALAPTLRAAAPHIDERGAIPRDVSAALAGIGVTDVFAGGARRALVALEEVAVASASLAAQIALGSADDAGDLPGLRGVGVKPGDPLTARQRLALAAIAIGIGRAAVEEAVGLLRASGERPSGDAGERPHWVLADAATEIDAARLLAARAAEAIDRTDGAEGEAAMAQLLAASAAARAVDAALRVIGPEAYRRGALVERLTRDVRAVALVADTEDQQRAVAATSLLPE